MEEQKQKQQTFTRRRRSPVLSAALAVVCATCVAVVRVTPVPTAIQWHGIVFSYSDIFVMLAAGIGGMGAGTLTFMLLFAAEFFRADGDFSGLYALSTYLAIIFLTARLSYVRWFAGWKKSTLSAALLSVVLTLCWFVTFSILIPAFRLTGENIYMQVSLWRLFVGAVPECALSVAAIALFFRYAPDAVKLRMGSGWLYTSMYEERKQAGGDKRRYVLGRRITALSIAEALLLVAMAILFSNIQAAVSMGEHFTLGILSRLWRENVQLGMTMLCAALPIGYVFNMCIMTWVVAPINEMSFFMERYFDSDEKRRVPVLPDLGITSGDEVEKLYHSLQKMVDDMAVYLDHILQQEKKSAHLTQGFMLALAKAVDAKDHYTSGHSVRVAQYAREIARRMGKSKAEQDNIYTMGLLHDIGKIGVSEAIINKNGRLTDEEFAQIKTHPVKGHDILRNVTELPALATGARWHHERYDGRGYPDGLSGTAIPEEARIIAVADAYDAMTSRRAYSDVRAQAEVRAEIARCKGSQFDPAIADHLLAMIDEDHDYTMREGGITEP